MGEDSSASSCPFAIELSFSCYICNSIALIDRWVRADVGRSAAIFENSEEQ
jgi:hypothetical protein